MQKNTIKKLIHTNMQNTKTKLEQREQLNTQSNADTNDKENYPLLTREQIEHSPFWIVGNKELGYKITWGKYTFNDQPFPTLDETISWYATHHWEITMQLIAIGFKIAEEATKKDTNTG